MTTLAKPLSIVAKCALCSTKTELFVCPHCDEVICQLCVNKHQSELNETLKEHWLQCKSKFQQLQESPDEATPPHSGADSCEEEVDHIRQTIEQRHLDFVRLIDKEKHALLVRLEDYLHVAGTRHADLQQSLQSLSQRFRNGLNPSYNPNDFLLEIEHLNAQMDYQERLMQADPLKYPYLTPPQPLITSDIFGELQWNSKPISNGHEYVAEEVSNHTPVVVARKQKQWTVDASGVPHFLCILMKKNYLLFACDKYGCIDLYQLDGSDPSNAPRHLRQFDLFPGNSNSQKPQIIEAFTVYTPFIVVSAHLSDQTDTSSVYFFDHRGSQQADTCLQNFPVRQLSADLGSKCLWGVDRHQHSVYYNQLPMSVSQILQSINHREEFIRFGRDFEPIRITQNQTSIAVVERNSQSVHIFDKQTKEQVDEVQNLLRTDGTFRLWNVLLRDDNSMVLKLDEDLPPYSRPQTIHHLIVELAPSGIPVAQIERTAVYGLALGPNQEILLGCKRHQQNGSIECYI